MFIRFLVTFFLYFQYLNGYFDNYTFMWSWNFARRLTLPESYSVRDYLIESVDLLYKQVLYSLV